MIDQQNKKKQNKKKKIRENSEPLIKGKFIFGVDNLLQLIWLLQFPDPYHC